MEYKEFMDFIAKVKEIEKFIVKAKKVKKKACLKFDHCHQCPFHFKEPDDVEIYCCVFKDLATMSEEQFNLIKNHINWEGVPIDTKVLVWNDEKYKHRAYFAGYKNDVIYTWDGGRTSFTTTVKNEWKSGELYKEDEENKEE